MGRMAQRNENVQKYARKFDSADGQIPWLNRIGEIQLYLETDERQAVAGGEVTMQLRPPLMRHMTLPVLHVPSLKTFHMMMEWQTKK